MLSFSTSTALLIVSTCALVRAVSVANFNCPNVTDGAIIRLRPCFKNTAYLTACTDTWCTKGSNDVIIREVSGADLKYTEWLVCAADSLPKGHVTLRNMGNDTGLGDLSVKDAAAMYLDDYKGDAVLFNPAAKPEQSQWRWDLRPDSRTCRVLLRNSLMQQKLGLIRNNGPMNNNNMKSFAMYKDGSALTDETWEVEFVRMSQATGVAGVAGAGAAKAPPPAPPVTVTVNNTVTATVTNTQSVTATTTATAVTTATDLKTTTVTSTTTVTAAPPPPAPTSNGYDVGPPPPPKNEYEV